MFQLFCLHFAMATLSGWEAILKERYGVFDVEKSLYKQYMTSLSTPCVLAQALCDGIRPTEVPFNLRKLYKEAVYGTNAKVRARILNRMNTIGRSVR